MSLSRPSPGPPREYRFPRFTRATLPNGLRLVICPVHRVPLTTLRVIVDTGAAAESAAEAGIAALAARVLSEGTTRRSGDDLVDALERLGGAVESDAGWDALELATTVRASRLGEACDVLAEMLTTPAFPAREVNRIREERLAELLQRRAEPRGLAQDAFTRAAFRKGCRSAEPLQGNEASVATLTAERLRAFGRSLLSPAATTVVVVGDLDPAAAITTIGAAFGDWHGVQHPAADVAADEAERGRGIHLVSKPDAVQTEIRVGHAGPPRGDDDYIPLVVMNAILGGLFNSRINLNLREAHGFTYGAFSSFDWRRARSLFAVSSAVRSDVTAAAVGEIVREISRIREEGVLPEELSLATSYLDGVFPIRFETTESIASALASLSIFGLSDDYFDTYRASIRGVTTDDVRRVAQTHLHPDRLRIVAVGAADSIRAPLEALEGGELRVFDPSGATLA